LFGANDETIAPLRVAIASRRCVPFNSVFAGDEPLHRNLDLAFSCGDPSLARTHDAAPRLSYNASVPEGTSASEKDSDICEGAL
jgi:hypothetical protein